MASIFARYGTVGRLVTNLWPRAGLLGAELANLPAVGNYGWDDATGLWMPITAGTPADSIVHATRKGLDVRGFNFIYNGGSWDCMDAVETNFASKNGTGLLASGGYLAHGAQDYRPIGSANVIGDAGVGLNHGSIAGMNYNDIAGTYERNRNNTQQTLMASGVRSVTSLTTLVTNYNAKGADFFFNISVVPGVDTVQFEVYKVDPISAATNLIFQGAALNSIGCRVYTVYPGVGPAAFSIAGTSSQILPRVYLCRIVHSSAVSNFTYSLSAGYVL